MDTLHFEYASPKAFILAARGSAASFTLEKDQVWELELSDHDIHPVCLHTTYGLRAREMRLFPAFTLENKRIAGLRDYISPPVVTRYLPDSFQVQCELPRGLRAHWDGYLAGGGTLVGTIMMTNAGLNSVSMTLELAALLSPMRKGAPIHADKDGLNQILVGQSGDLFPVLFMTGGPNAVISPFPALAVPVQLAPGQSRRLTWALSTLDSAERSLTAARHVSAMDWQSIVREHSLEQERQTISIHTGEPDWDAAFFLSQIQARVHYLTSDLDSLPVYLRSRLPDESVTSSRNIPFADDLTLLETLHLFQVLGPTDSASLRRVLDSFLDRVDLNGILPSRLLSMGQNNPVSECPLLSRLYLSLYEIDGDLFHLEKVFPNLCRLFEGWFMYKGELNFEKLPTWDNPGQMQCDTGLYHFDVWEETSQGMDIRRALSPALLAMLVSEVLALTQIARLLKDPSSQKKYHDIAKSLSEQIQATWDERSRVFTYQDIQTRQNPARELYFPGRVQKRLEIKKVFLVPQRLQLHLTSSDQNTRVCRLMFIGLDSEGNPIEEIVKSPDVRWVMGRAHITTSHCFHSLEALAIEGLKSGDRFLLETVEFSQPDITCFLPLWAGEGKGNQSKLLLSSTLDPEGEGFAFGIPETWEAGHELPRELPVETNVLWNSLIISGLQKAGHQKTAAQHFSHLMAAIANGLRHYAGFFPYYSAQTGQPAGPRNTLAGLAPVHLFLSLAGIRLFSSRKVAVWGQNPFPWPVEVHWQGLSVRRDALGTLIVFPDGTRYQGIIGKPTLFTLPAEQEVHDAQAAN